MRITCGDDYLHDHIVYQFLISFSKVHLFNSFFAYFNRWGKINKFLNGFQNDFWHDLGLLYHFEKILQTTHVQKY